MSIDHIAILLLAFALLVMGTLLALVDDSIKDILKRLERLENNNPLKRYSDGE